jgi:hypothetical protein
MTPTSKRRPSDAAATRSTTSITNAGFTVWADGAYQVSVMELSDPAYDGQKLSFKVKPVEGQLPKAGEHTSVFIDWCNQVMC